MNLLPPPGFSAFRSGQLEAANKIMDSHHIGIVGPTGTGKSIVYMTAAYNDQRRSLVLTSTKSLQDQLERDFRAFAVSIKGADNYPCILDRECSAANAPCTIGQRCQYKEEGCPYYDKIREALGSQVVIANYAKWLAVQRFAPTQLGPFHTIYLDEGHNAPQELENAFTLKVDRSILTHLQRMPWPPGSKRDDWRNWLRVAAAHLRAKFENDPTQVGWMRIANQMTFIALDEREYVYDTGPVIQRRNHKTWAKFTPLDVEPFAQTLIPDGVRAVLLSATLDHHVLDSLGIKGYQWLEMEHTFPVEHRPIIYVPTVPVRYGTSNMEYEFWIARLDDLVEDRLAVKRKGIIHFHSFKLLTKWMRATRIPKETIATHYAASERESVRLADAVEDFRNNGKMVLASPSAKEGLDFPGDAARWQIVAKVPFPSKGDKVIEARMERNRRYLDIIAARQLVQTCGRIVRSYDDWGETLIIDDCFTTFRKRARDLLPKWFRDAVRESNVISPMNHK